ncbi:CxC2 domain-containing protein [Salix suchowensis]|nr:CxC2 domain-containing protein [Salix suchowensis]
MGGGEPEEHQYAIAFAEHESDSEGEEDFGYGCSLLNVDGLSIIDCENLTVSVGLTILLVSFARFLHAAHTPPIQNHSEFIADTMRYTSRHNSHQTLALLGNERLLVDVEYSTDRQGHDTPPPPTLPSTIHRHTEYDSRGDRIRARRSYYQADPHINRPTQAPVAPNDDGGITADDTFTGPVLDTETVYGIIGQRRRVLGDSPLLVWLQERDAFLREFIRLEGRDDATALCPTPDCPMPAAFRCPQCFDTRLFCQDCIVANHTANPFHQVERWNSRFFDRCSLRSLGLRIQLGHPLGQACHKPAPAFGDGFVVITSHGVVCISLDFCDCTSAIPRELQLLRARLFPATTVDPRTAATFELLRLFQLLTFGSKVSGFEFYQSLVRLTNNLGEPVPDRYTAFMRIVREWRHIRLLKRAGRGHSTSGVLGTAEGECAVLCPACPQPGKNLPSDWQDTPDSKRWIYALFLAIDANFRLKRLSASNDVRDPGLNRGYAYFVEERKYKDFLASHTAVMNSVEPSTCNNYDAVKLASLRGGKGTTASGVGTIECSRHDMKRPVSVGDLQLGERFNTLTPNTRSGADAIRPRWGLSHPEYITASRDDSRLHQVRRSVIETSPRLLLLMHEIVVSATKVRLALAQEDTAALAQEGNMAVHESISASVLISQGLDLQEQIARLQVDIQALGSAATDHQRTLALERQNRLLRRISTWQAVQELYMPGVTAVRRRTNSSPSGDISQCSIILPSDVLTQIPFDVRLAEYEWRLRHGLAFDYLAEVRRQLLVLSSMYQSKDRYSRGQAHNTRSVMLIKNVQARIVFAKTKYTMNRAALVVLSDFLGKEGWQSSLKVLADEDVRSLKGGDDASSSKGRRTLSWIWMTAMPSGAEVTETMNEEESYPALRIEWCKSRARAQRWQEECVLLQEEMRRVIQFHQSTANQWLTRANEAETEGARAYAWRQQAVRETLLTMCRETWKDVGQFVEMGEGAVKAGQPLIECCDRVRP